MSNNCALCTFQENCSEEAIFLYATTPILRDILSCHLKELGAEFKLQNDLFAITGNHQVLRDLRKRLAQSECADVRVSRNRGASLMASPSLAQWDLHMDSSWFEKAVHADTFTSFFQPIVDVEKNLIFAHECLIRLFADRAYNGGEIIEAAVSRGQVHLFDAYARKLSIRQAAKQHQPGTKIFINFMPSSIYDPAYCMKSTLEEMRNTHLQPTDIVFEVVESEAVTDSKHLRKICDYYRRENFGFALDDVGAGSNSFQMICDIQPDFIKLDKSLISKIDEPMYYAAVGKLAEFADQFHLKVIAEGIETAETAEKLKSLEISLMQGYYFGKPSAQMKASFNDLIQLSSNVGQSQAILSPEMTAPSA